MSEVSKVFNIDENNEKNESSSIFKACNNASNLPMKPTFASKMHEILFYEIKVELTPYQQKIEDEINEFLHKEITWSMVKDFLFQDITFGKKKSHV